MKDEEAYQALAKKLAQCPGGAPPAPELFELLKLYYTPEEAEFILQVPHVLQPLDQIAGQMGKPKEEVETALETLADKGRVLRIDKQGIPHYAIIGTIPGYQTSFWSGNSDEKAVKGARLWHSYYQHGWGKTMTGTESMQGLRIIPVEKSLDDKRAVLPYDLVSQRIEAEDYFSVSSCPCRVINKLNGLECSHRIESCIKTGNIARFIVDRNLGREITREEAHKISQECQEEGLVAAVVNYDGPAGGFCFCCSCCCVNLRGITELNNPFAVRRSHYLVQVNKDSCEGCGTCEERCPVGAIRLHEDVATVDETRCIGCAVCTITCPAEALSLKAREGIPPLPDDSDPMVKALKDIVGL